VIGQAQSCLCKPEQTLPTLRHLSGKLLAWPVKQRRWQHQQLTSQRFFSVWFKMSFKQKLVVRGKTYDCPMVWAFGNQREPYRASVSQCDCELMGDQFEKRWVVSLVRNKDFVPARPTGLEGICQL